MRSYLDLLRSVLHYGGNRTDRTGVGTISCFGLQFRHDMQLGFPLLTTKQIPLRWVFEELAWFLRGSTDELELRAKGVDIWQEWATQEQCAKYGRREGDLGPIYGHQWRSFGGSKRSLGYDQIYALLRSVEKDPFSRRHIVTGWNPTEIRAVALPPCHTLFQVYVHDDRSMSLHMYQRSGDVFLGVPFNIASYALLLEMLCEVLNYTPRELVISFGDLHLYRNHIEQANEQLRRTPKSLPAIAITSPEIGDPLSKLLGIRWENVQISNYLHHGKIDAPVAV